MRKVESREYKIMLDNRSFVEGRPSVRRFWGELRRLAESLQIETKGSVESPERRSVLFLDTPDFTLRRNGVVLRRREVPSDDEVEYTLKCRSEDRYVADGFDLDEGEELKNDRKFEEDIAPPFRSRFSHSNTVSLPASGDHVPKRLKEAADLFPGLGKLRTDGLKCRRKTRLDPVNDVTAFERVYKGPKLRFKGMKSTIAVILWSDGADGRPLVAEFSFRYKDGREEYSPKVARLARTFFEAAQRLDWCSPNAMTKTQYVYRGTT